MVVTIQNALNTIDSNIKALTGDAGLNNIISCCGILDYECDPAVKDKYTKTNFTENQLILSSLLFAKDNEFLLLDAIKTLIDRKCSGLIIKNIFKLNIPQNIIRYAIQNNFPIFIAKDNEIYFEQVIVNISNLVKEYNSIEYFTKKVDLLLNSNENNQMLINHSKEINPSFCSDLVVFFFDYRNNNYLEKQKLFNEAKIFKDIDSKNSLLIYKTGILFIHTKEMFKNIDYEQLLNNLSIIDRSTAFIGVSSIHHDLSNLKDALNEAIYTSLLSTELQTLNFYNDLGTYQILLPFINSHELTNYCNHYLKRIKDYNHENQTDFLTTLKNYIIMDGDMDRVAQALSLHKNTIRYRLDKICNILELDILKKSDYEKITVAIKIEICQNALSGFE